MEQLKRGYKYRVCFATGILLGIMIGAASISVIVSYRMDQYYQDVAYLKNMIEDKNARLLKLEETVNSHTQSMIVEEIEVNLTFDGDEMDKIDIEKTIKEKYSTLLGKEVKNIDADITAEVLENRIFKIEDREYKLHVARIIVAEIFKIYIDVDRLGG
jgi:MFS superfamily sulfate permease-like transporter